MREHRWQYVSPGTCRVCGHTLRHSYMVLQTLEDGSVKTWSIELDSDNEKKLLAAIEDGRVVGCPAIDQPNAMQYLPINACEIHRDEKVWEDARQINLDRDREYRRQLAEESKKHR